MPLDRAQQRAEDKASRAAAAGIKLPARKKKNGWAILREKLKDHTLVRDLHKADGKPQRLSATARRSSLHALKDHLADVAYTMNARRTMAISTADSKLLAEHTKAAQELTKRKRNERQSRRKLIKKQRKLERELEYLNFPTILGWYFDGFFTPYFQLNEEYATIFNQMELDISKAKENAIKETFAEKAKRYFWPPDILCNLCFRTRGIYLDLKEVIQDPPHTPPEIILDQRVEAVTLFVAPDQSEYDSKVPSDEEDVHVQGKPAVSDAAADEDRIHDLMKSIDDNPDLKPDEKAAKKRALLFAFKKQRERNRVQQQVAEEMHFKATNKNDYYFDDQIPGFFKKRPRDRDKYYYDSKWDVWRIKRKIVYFPNDFYWDEQLAIFFPKDRTRQPDYYLYDPSLGAYRVAGEPVPPNWRGIKPSHFYFDHKIGKWVKKTKAPDGVSPFLDNNGQRFCVNKNVDTPDDFYFELNTQQFEKKHPDGRYTYDSNLGAWKNVHAGEPVKRSLKPIDFYWNEKENTFTKKDAPASFFAWDTNNKFFRKKRSLHGKFHPKNWIWQEKKKLWELKKFASRHNLISESVYWRPDRDYDKPWLEYVGGYKDYHIEYDYEDDEDDGIKMVGSGGKVLGKTGTGTGTGAGTPTATGGASSAKGGKKLQFSTSEPSLRTAGGTPTASSQGRDASKSIDDKEAASVGSAKPDKPDGIMKGAAAAASNTENLAFVDTLDRKTLKVTNLGSAVNDYDLRKYFASVKKIVRPKKPDTDIDEDYAYLKFKTDEAAAAALKTMHEQVIRGQRIKLAYKLKEEDETVGGQRDAAPKQPGITF